MFTVKRRCRWRPDAPGREYETRDAAIAYARRYSKMNGFIRCDVLDEDGNRVYRLTADGTENFALVPAED